MTLDAHSTIIPERRRHPRTVTALPAAFTTPEGEEGEGNTLDLSAGGCKLHSLSPLLLHAQIELQIFIAGESIPITVPMGLIRWTDGTHCGVEFLQLTDVSRRLLRHLFGHQLA